jgi:CRISPR/Cas system-associated endonuclease/helicase Cas3
VDFKRFCGGVANESLDPQKDLTHPALSRKFNAAKPLAEMKKLNSETVRQHHKPWTLTLVVLNTVHGAQELYTYFRDQLIAAQLKRKYIYI